MSCEHLGTKLIDDVMVCLDCGDLYDQSKEFRVRKVLGGWSAKVGAKVYLLENADSEIDCPENLAEVIKKAVRYLCG